MIVSEMENKNNPSPLKNRIIAFQYRKCSILIRANLSQDLLSCPFSYPGDRIRMLQVLEIKGIDDQRLMPVKFYRLPNAYFAGDWCQGEGQLSELSFTSAYEVTSRIMKRPMEQG
jgi:hypothetical protein